MFLWLVTNYTPLSSQYKALLVRMGLKLVSVLWGRGKLRAMVMMWIVIGSCYKSSVES
jgi:hypothetical protein